MPLRHFILVYIVDLGFDFSDDQDDYETYDDGNLSFLTEKPDVSTDLQHHLAVETETLTQTQQQQQQQLDTSTAVALYKQQGGNGNDIGTLRSHDSQQQQQQQQQQKSTISSTVQGELPDNELYTNEPDMLVETNDLLEDSEEGYNTNSLLQAILTEGKENSGQKDYS